ncbi:MAG: cytochrome d ubiquinol oxidase, subunit [Candidatus Eremiobacteraeota bacterium]|nr:cytochrome d ubiquinol oxidase, subunit [Candidatus Eremiobacteraeota bacterium]
MDNVIADRAQFALTVMFHYLFPVVTMGLAPFIALFWLRAASGHDPLAERAGRFWTRIFAISFAAGVVTGIPLEFEFGTNWATFSARTGSVIGQPLAMEASFAFFLESVFLGALLYGRDRLGPRLHALSAVAVWIGSWLSGFFIVATNAWMQHPVGYAVGRDGTVTLTDIGAVLLSAYAWWQYLHVITGALVAASFIVAGVGAFSLLAERNAGAGRVFVRLGTTAALVFSALAIFPTGDRNGHNVTTYQPVALAAMEGLFHTERGAPLAIIGMPDTSGERLIDAIEVPGLLSFLAYGNFDANVEGLSAYPRALWPPVALTYYAYHVMIGLGTIFLAIGILGAFLLWRGRLYSTRWFLWVLLLAVPFPLIANEAGWVAAEVGRQPWIAYGLIRTEHGASPNVLAAETLFTTIGFAGVYLFLGALYLVLVLREIGAEG